VVAAVPGGGRGPVAACAEVVAPLDRCGLAVAVPIGAELVGHASQLLKGAPGLASSTTSGASACPPGREPGEQARDRVHPLSVATVGAGWGLAAARGAGRVDVATVTATRVVSLIGRLILRLGGRGSLVEQELAGLGRSSGHASDRSDVGLGRRAARRRALRAGAPTCNRRPAAPAARPSKRLPQIEQAARTGRKRGTQPARRSQAVAPAPRADGATQPPVVLTRVGHRPRRTRAGAYPADGLGLVDTANSSVRTVNRGATDFQIPRAWGLAWLALATTTDERLAAVYGDDPTETALASASPEVMEPLAHAALGGCGRSLRPRRTS
jgi:hypothetical protein